MDGRKFILLALLTGLSQRLLAAPSAPDPTYTLHQEEVAKSIENPLVSWVANQIHPATHWNAKNPGYTVIVKVSLNEQGETESTTVQASDDLSGGKVLDEIAQQLAAKFKQAPRLEDGVAVKSTALLPFFFPVEYDEGPNANDAPKPTLLTGKALVFPEALVAKRENGGAILELTISDHGIVQRVKVLSSSHPACGEAAAATAKTWTFIPAKKDGLPIQSRWRIAIAFNADGKLGDYKWRVAPRPSLGAYVVPMATPSTQNSTSPATQ